MMANLTIPTVPGYLDELGRSLRDLPRARQKKVIRDIRAHIDAALVDAGDPSPAEIASILDHLGAPDEIAAAALADLPPVPPRIATRDVITIVLLLIGGVVLPVVGWIVGVVFLWSSNAWRARDKVLATLVVPGGLLPVLVLGTVRSTT